jgi:tetratricopeptide (TPR) repeat protein
MVILSCSLRKIMIIHNFFSWYGTSFAAFKLDNPIMKRKISIVVLFFSFLLQIPAQPEIRGILLYNLGKYNIGDTILISGYSYDKTYGTGKYLVGSDDIKMDLPDTCVKLTENYGFWTQVWLKNRMSDISKKSWQDERREILQEDFDLYISEMRENNLVYRDDYLENYLRNLMLAIHPECLVKPVEKEIEIIILKLANPEIYAFDHGVIVITTGKIAETESEEDLAWILSECTAHIVLEDNLVNLNKTVNFHDAAFVSANLFNIASNIAGIVFGIRGEYNFLNDAFLLARDLSSIIADFPVQPNVDNYSSQQSLRSGRIAQECMDYLVSENYSFHNCCEYGMIMSSVIRDCAWNEYFQENYLTSLELINKLTEPGLGDEEDWLLKARIYTNLYDDTESNQKALAYIETAQQLDHYHLAEVLLVKGIVLMRLERLEEAREVLNEFILASENTVVDEYQLEEAENLLSECNSLLENK